MHLSSVHVYAETASLVSPATPGNLDIVFRIVAAAT